MAEKEAGACEVTEHVVETAGEHSVSLARPWQGVLIHLLMSVA